MKFLLRFILEFVNYLIGNFFFVATAVWLLFVLSDLKWLWAFPLVFVVYWLWLKLWRLLEAKLASPTKQDDVDGAQ